MSASEAVGGTRSFLPAVEGMRACAAVGVMVTHVAFQTGRSVDGSWLGAVWGRFDMAVALFFALSGYLLWRARTPRPPATRTAHMAVPADIAWCGSGRPMWSSWWWS